MEKSKIDLFIGLNAENFTSADLMSIRVRLEHLDDEKFYFIQGAEFQKPATILLIAILLGWERFWLEDVFLGILKLITAYGCLIWWVIDITTAKARTKKYNFKKFSQLIALT